MKLDRRAFVATLGAATVGAAGARAVAGSPPAPGSRPAPAAAVARQTDPVEAIEAFAFDAYGTLFDVFSVTALCEELFPGNGDALAQRWRAKQLQYSLLRSLMGRHRDFWLVTEDALVYAARSLELDLTAARRARLMDAYLWKRFLTCGRGWRRWRRFPTYGPAWRRSGRGECGWRFSRTASRGCWRRRPAAPASTPCSTRSSASRR